MDVVIFDPGAQLAQYLYRLLKKLKLAFVWAKSVPDLLALLGDAAPRLLLLSDRVSPEDTRALRSRFPQTRLAMIYGSASPTDFATAAAALFEAVKQGVLTWKLKQAPKLCKDFVNQYLLVFRPGKIICGHRIGPEIGRGGFGRVYRCTNLASREAVAVKVIKGNDALQQELEALRKVSKLSKESEFLMPVSHPEFYGEHLCLFMPLADMIQVGNEVKPASLDALLQQKGGRFSLLEALAVVQSVLQGIKALHDAGLQHGDATLRNILLLKGRFVLSDLGLVRRLGEPGIYATPHYYPSSRTGTPGDDLHAAGVILFTLTTGKAPKELDALRLDFYERSKHPIFRIIANACNRNPDQRYQSAAAMIADVDAALAQAVASQNRTNCQANSGTGSGAALGRR